ncbi:MAG: DUF1540 domain-containing protein [Cellulomonadaceae bacterium]|jgi:hypothetical protein|nr:DUF1540 domain-containing protein [Cellulomonadaceae bacterium]
MANILELPAVGECTIDGCSYNHDHACGAGAITIGGTPGDASCVTFIALDAKGGLSKQVAAVGACQRADCSHNDALECAAPSVRIGAGVDDPSHADCLTFAAR